MKISFTQIYAEVGATFDLPFEFLSLIKDELSSTGFSIEKLKKKYGEAEFTLVLILTASSKLSAVEVKGPVYQRKLPKVEYALWIPHARHSSRVESLLYVTKSILDGIALLASKYDEKCPDLGPTLVNVKYALSTHEYESWHWQEW